MPRKAPGSKYPPVRVSSEIARGESLPTLTKTKAFRALLLLAENQSAPPKPGDIYEIPQNAIRDMLRCRDDAHLKQELEGLGGIKVNWSRVRPDEGGYSIPVSSCTWSEKTGQVRFAFDPQFVMAWLDNTLGFRRITWEVLVSFRSLYGAKLYEYCAISHEPGKPIKTRRLSTEELRELLGVPPTAYQGGNAGRFFQEVKKAVAQVNEAQDGMWVEYHRDGRGKHARHWFLVLDGPKQGRMPFSNPSKVVPPRPDLRSRIENAIAALPEERRAKVLEEMQKQGFGSIPAATESMLLKQYGGRLRGEGVEY